MRVAAALEGAGYKVIRATDALEGLRKIYESYPDVIIIDKGLPEVSGEDACLRIRQASYLPIIVLGGREDAAESLELGADAFMTTPPSLRELVARVRSLLKRKPSFDKRDDDPGGLNINNSNIESNPPSENGNGLGYLSATEFRLASCLVLNKGRLLDYSRLIAEVWAGREVTLATLNFYVHRLRKKLQAFFPNPIQIINYRGIGYCLEEINQQSN
jgi:two-component system response regulator ArlR